MALQTAIHLEVDTDFGLAGQDNCSSQTSVAKNMYTRGAGENWEMGAVVEQDQMHSFVMVDDIAAQARTLTRLSRRSRCAPTPRANNRGTLCYVLHVAQPCLSLPAFNVPSYFLICTSRQVFMVYRSSSHREGSKSTETRPSHTTTRALIPNHATATDVKPGAFTYLASNTPLLIVDCTALFGIV